ncbi:hypothetical protein [uncultured Treponema sp.]|jgi:hypothetical protein|uniref:hypothetical protein n=1 Tax=uncultured Treponema sp. TaxID=162155 RepID=UPI0025D76B23|nr:hypothetical protein [uncultured Treponema sp.]MEE0887439.1 hypothetical protein [Treponema sp.]
MSILEKLHRHTESVVGLSISQIKSYSPEKLRSHLEKKNNKKFTFTTEFPVIGRGNVLRENFVTSEQLNKEIDKILR